VLKVLVLKLEERFQAVGYESLVRLQACDIGGRQTSRGLWERKVAEPRGLECGIG
jgi:hypothetical protein